MASFSMSEISSMISSKKYRIQRGDTLSGLADKFQGSFPSAKCMNKSSLMDKMYNMNRPSFLGNKDLILEGKDLDLKFMCDCRCYLKIDKSKKEYVFNDEDRLVFAIKGQNNFWDDFIKVDRNIGEYMKETFNNMPSSNLPQSMPMPMTASFSSSGGHRKLMEEIKRNLSGNMVTTNQIAEAFLKMSGSSYSNSQVQDLAVKLEKENGTCRCHANAPCSAPRDKLEQLGVRSLWAKYNRLPVCRNSITDIKKGRYVLTFLDKIYFESESNKDVFWDKLIKISGMSSNDFHKIRSNFGYRKDRLEHDTIFIPSKEGLDSITFDFGTKQAEEMVCYLIDSSGLYPTVRNQIHTEKQEDGNTYYEQLQRGVPYCT